MRMIICALCVSLAGCSTLASEEVTVACQAADVITTVSAINRGAVEQSPIWKPVIERFGLAGFVAGKIAMTWALVHYKEQIGDESAAAVNIVTCAVAANNVRVMK